MDTFRKDLLSSLINARKGPCISIYIPTYHAGPDIQQNRIRFKKMVGQAKDLLLEKGWKSAQADKFLLPLKGVFHDVMFWQHPSEGAAFFLNEDLFRSGWMPIHFQEQLLVEERFLICPLLPLFMDEHTFYLLAISENRIRFLKGSLFDIHEVMTKSIPHSLKEALRFNDPERQLQLHTQTPHIPGERAAAIFHGHGVGIDDEKDDLQEYCRQVDRGLHQILKNEKAPLVVASVEALFSTYAKMNTYPYLVEDAIIGNPELLSDNELRSRAWKVLAPHFAKGVNAVLQKYVDLAGTNLVSNNVEEILHAAGQGRVQFLILNSDQPWWGRFTEETGRLESRDVPGPGDTEVVNLVVLEAMKTGSKVYRLQPVDREYPSILAIYRY